METKLFVRLIKCEFVTFVLGTKEKSRTSRATFQHRNFSPFVKLIRHSKLSTRVDPNAEQILFQIMENLE